MKYVWLALLMLLGMSMQATDHLSQAKFSCSNETVCRKAEKLLQIAQNKYHEAALRLRINDPSAALWFETAQRSACRAMHMLLYAYAHGCLTCIEQAVEGVHIVERICEKRCAFDSAYTVPLCLTTLCKGMLLVCDANRHRENISAESLFQHSSHLHEEALLLQDVLEQSEANTCFLETCEVAMQLQLSASQIALQAAEMGHPDGEDLSEGALNSCYSLARIFFERYDPEEYGISELFEQMLEAFSS